MRKLRGQTVAMIFQDPLSSLHPFYTIGAQIVEAYRVHNDVSKAVAKERAIDMLNELELIDGAVWANVWQTDRIVRIDPTTGRVTAWIDASPLRREITVDENEGVLNGIAWDAANHRLYLTGKLWPTLFEVRVRPAG